MQLNSDLDNRNLGQENWFCNGACLDMVKSLLNERILAPKFERTQRTRSEKLSLRVTWANHRFQLADVVEATCSR